MKITVLGAGLIGSAIVKDLAKDRQHSVTAVDIDEEHLAHLDVDATVSTIMADLQDTSTIGSLVAETDLVICAVPGYMGFTTLKSIIEAGKNVVDISFFPEDPMALDDLAKSRHVTAVVDCGVAPGLSNIIAGYVDAQLDHTERYCCYVGGLPRIRQWPYEYKAVFSPIDVLEEYTRPARFVEYGQEVIRPALTDIELRDFPGVGTLEAFNTDGLRTLRHTLRAPFMIEKTLRYPGHANLMQVFRESGFFNTGHVKVEGQMIRPIALTSHLLFDQLRSQSGEDDFTVMQVIVEGMKDGRSLTYTYNLLDWYDTETETTSMARTTGYTCTLIARQVLKKLFTRKGICPPEWIGSTPGCFANLLTGYQKRNIALIETIAETSLNA
ncbi:MAG: saccharopine dehydrogenase [Anaerolineales bacterium]|nr:MAG: saccharopine dehydrogenase [Anaerolineales bacterium]